MIKWIRSRRSSIKNSLSAGRHHKSDGLIFAPNLPYHRGTDFNYMKVASLDPSPHTPIAAFWGYNPVYDDWNHCTRGCVPRRSGGTPNANSADPARGVSCAVEVA